METVAAAPASPPAHHHDANVRERLFDVALDLFASRGYAATSVREIVKGAGSRSPSSITTSEARRGLYLEIMRRLEGTVQETLQGLGTRRGSARSRIRRLALGIWDVFSKNTARSGSSRGLLGAAAGDAGVRHRVASRAPHRRIRGARRGRGRRKGVPERGRCRPVVRAPGHPELRHGLPPRAPRPGLRAGTGSSTFSTCSCPGPRRPAAEEPPDETDRLSPRRRRPCPSSPGRRLLAGQRRGTAAARPAVAVEVAPVVSGDLKESIAVVGALTPKFQAEVKTEYSGTVTDVLVTEWVRVSKGTILLRFDAREAEAGAAAARGEPPRGRGRLEPRPAGAGEDRQAQGGGSRHAAEPRRREDRL